MRLAAANLHGTSKAPTGADAILRQNRWPRADDDVLGSHHLRCMRPCPTTAMHHTADRGGTGLGWDWEPMASPLICLFRSHLAGDFYLSRAAVRSLGDAGTLAAAVREATRPGVGIEGAHAHTL
jgi:hypothetical protein